MTISWENVLEELKTLLVQRDVLESCDVPGTSALTALGVDSIELALAFAHFEQRYDAEFENQEIDHSRYQSLIDVARAIAAKLPARDDRSST